jgi:replication factor C subunit 3/5
MPAPFAAQAADPIMVDSDDIMQVEPAVVPTVQPSAPPAAEPVDESALMWVEKYRPRGLTDLLSQAAVVQTLRKLIASNNMPHLLFHGPPGTGKTSAILACAREMYGADFRSMVLELNASDDRGINVVREQIKSFASTRRIFSSGIKLIILDEADAMTSVAQMALRRVVEKYVANARFCLICNYVNKIMPALQSRCTKFRFGPLTPDDARARVLQIAAAEAVDLAPGAVDALLDLAHGDMRRVLNILQSTHMAVSPAVITADSFYANTGDPHPSDVAQLFESLLVDDFSACAARVAVLKAEKGVALSDILTGLAQHVARAPPERIPPPAKIYLYQQIADAEHRLMLGASEKINTAALIGAFAFASAMASRSGSKEDPL